MTLRLPHLIVIALVVVAAFLLWKHRASVAAMFGK